MPASTWAPSRRGPIPPAIQEALKARLLRHANRKWKRHVSKVLVRFNGRYAYIAAVERGRKEAAPISIERYAGTGQVPVELCRLGYLGLVDRWEYAFFKYSDERYEPSVSASGRFTATPEECLDTSAEAYLAGGNGGAE